MIKTTKFQINGKKTGLLFLFCSQLQKIWSWMLWSQWNSTELWVCGLSYFISPHRYSSRAKYHTKATTKIYWISNHNQQSTDGRKKWALLSELPSSFFIVVVVLVVVYYYRPLREESLTPEGAVCFMGDLIWDNICVLWGNESLLLYSILHKTISMYYRYVYNEPHSTRSYKYKHK